MNTLDLGRYINTLDLGLPFGEALVEERELGGRQFYEEEQQKIQQRRLHEQIMQEDHDITEFIRTLLSKGLI